MMGLNFNGFKSFAILAVPNFANINSNEYFCPVGYIDGVEIPSNLIGQLFF